MELSNDELNRYSRQIVLDEVGYTGQVKLKNARVCIVGVGGLGCPIATQLAAMGVGSLRLIVRDVVERSNLHRQHLFDVNYVGYPKVEAAAKKLRALNPDVTVEPIPMSLSGANARELLQGADVVVDGLDSIETRYTVNRACVELNIPYIYGGALTTYGAVSTIIPGETACLESAHAIFNEFPDLGITPLCFTSVFYCQRCEGMANARICPHRVDHRHEFSGTKLRDCLVNGQVTIPGLRPEVCQVIRAWDNPFIKA